MDYEPCLIMTSCGNTVIYCCISSAIFYSD